MKLGRYELQAKLAVGGMAEIWLARQSGPAGFTKELVIKKILPHLTADKTFVEMFLNEGRLAALVNHPNVVQVFELGQHGEDYFLVMEHVAGWSLRAVLRRLGERGEQAPIGCIARLMAQVCRGLHAAHELTDASGRPQQLVHRDVSPENVLVSKSGEAKVADFGIAKAVSAAGTTRPGETKGKLAYMPPEQLLGKPLDRRADVYAIGATLYELVAGKRPFMVAADAALSLEILEARPPPLSALRSDVPPELVAVIERCLEKDVSARWPDALAVARELEPLGGTAEEVAAWLAQLFPEGPAAPKPSPVALPATAPVTAAEVAPRGERRAAAVVAVTALAVLAIGGAALLLWPRSAPAPAPLPAPVRAPVVVEAPRPVEEPAAAEAPAPAPAVAKKPAKPVGRGKLLVRVNPWADVLIDGQVVGATPLAPLELPAGRHSVTVTNGELGRAKSVSVEVRAGRQELVEINLAK